MTSNSENRRPRVLVVGASGTLGRAVVAELAQRHEVIAAARSEGDVRIDLTDVASIRAAFDSIGRVDAIVSTAGKVPFQPLAEMTAALYEQGLDDKLMGQVNLVLEGRAHLNDGGSFTLIGGILAEQFIRSGTSASMVNGALEAFVRATAIELPRGLRINLVSPNVFAESMPGYAPWFRGFEPVPVARAALAYSRSVEGAETGQIYRVF